MCLASGSMPEGSPLSVDQPHPNFQLPYSGGGADGPDLPRLLD